MMKKILLKILICNLIFLILIILGKSNEYYKKEIYNRIYNDNINFSYFKEVYNKYLGGTSILKKDNYQKENYVFNETITYTNKSKYYDGVKLEVKYNYLIPSQKEGIVVYIGNKEKYDNVIIIEDDKGIYNWYGNICNTNVKIYDYIKKGSYLGESCKNYIYLAFSKNNSFLNYENFIK